MEDFIDQVLNPLKIVQDVTARVDERVKMILERQSDVDHRITMMLDQMNNMSSRITILEARDDKSMRENVERTVCKVHELEKQVSILVLNQAGSDGKWKQIISFGVQLALALTTAYIAIKLGLSKP